MFYPFLPGEDLIAPCHCKGTQKYVHRSCLDNWRSTKVNSWFFLFIYAIPDWHLDVSQSCLLLSFDYWLLIPFDNKYSILHLK